MTRQFPDGFLWGAATAAHQIEGGNVASDWWKLEHRPDGPCAEPSGDACDSYHRYPEDVAIVAGLGLGSYRFSIEWSRIEPEPGEFSRVQLDHYRRMIATVLDAGLRPTVTLHHFTSPFWFTKGGGWARADSADRFLRYCETVAPLLTEAAYVCTFNEPNIAASFARYFEPGYVAPAGLPDPDSRISDGLTRAHLRVRDALRAEVGPRVGWAVATQSFSGVDGPDELSAAYAYERETRFLEVAVDDDWLGVQAYSRTIVGPDGPLPVSDETERTLMDWEYYPEALGSALREAHRIAPRVPLIVTENGIAAADDRRRIDYVRTALGEVLTAIDDGVDVRGYFYWSLLDNFEWAHGYRPTFGLVAVDRDTFARIPRPSAHWLGAVARANALDAD
ncbi:beta-glucosidase [Leifsonia sp. Root4]|uniref:glycoside hydrolase family 1 protein n=1 Tax=Leifsonia sp. Root4 TaxID=1736525 RepID=UPI0006F3A883|nr:family 1 glycosylhydrolase [Leifsonia sp. Root4]KQW05596.1 beta-glucosidase [Leifsonia sp. Root4]